jgi:hypothetical protein
LAFKGLNYLMQSLQRQVIITERQLVTEDKKVISNKVKFEIFGEEMLRRVVKINGKSGRVYLPYSWVGHKVKIIMIE